MLMLTMFSMVDASLKGIVIAVGLPFHDASFFKAFYPPIHVLIASALVFWAPWLRNTEHRNRQKTDPPPKKKTTEEGCGMTVIQSMMGINLKSILQLQLFALSWHITLTFPGFALGSATWHEAIKLRSLGFSVV